MFGNLIEADMDFESAQWSQNRSHLPWTSAPICRNGKLSDTTFHEATSLIKRQEMLTASMAWKSEAFLGMAGAHCIGWVSAREQGRAKSIKSSHMLAAIHRHGCLTALLEIDSSPHR